MNNLKHSIKLSSLCEVVTKGTTPTSVGHSFTPEGKVNFIKVESLSLEGKIIKTKVASISEECHNSLFRSQLKENDILFSIAGALGRVGIVQKEILPANTNQALAIIRLKDKNDITIKFLQYYFKSFSILQQINSFKGGVAQQNLSLTQIKEFVVPQMEVTEQQAIVEKLDFAFDAIEKAKANIEKNIENAKELFQSKLNEIFSQKGEGWEEKKLSEVCTLLNGRAYNRTELLSEGKYVVLRVGNFFTNKHWYYSNLELEKNKYCDNGDLLYAWSASFGPKIWKGGKVIYHYHIWKVIPNELITKEFLFILFDWDKEKIKKEQGAGTTMIHVSKGSMENRLFSIPPIKIQQSMVDQINQFSFLTNVVQEKYKQKLAILEELKKSILEKAFKGELVLNENK